MTQAPDRERLRERVVAPGVTRRVEVPAERTTSTAAGSGSRFDRTAWNKAVMVLNVALIGGVAIAGLTYVRNADAPGGGGEVAGPPPGVASTLAQPETDDPGGPVVEAPPPAVTEGPVTVPPAAPPVAASEPAPEVPVRMRSEFAGGDAWPVGAGFRESGSLAWPLGVVDGLMTHGPARSAGAVSWLEKWTKSDVRRIGARVVFAPNHSGSAALTAWHTSILDLAGQATPRTGMRLVVTPTAWRLEAIDAKGAETISSAGYALSGRSARFDMVRKGETVWVTDPTGLVTAVTDPRVASLSGPWASWELREDKVGKRPAGFAEVWAG